MTDATLEAFAEELLLVVDHYAPDSDRGALTTLFHSMASMGVLGALMANEVPHDNKTIGRRLGKLLHSFVKDHQEACN